MGKPKIYFRADGNQQIGLGHVSRCCALAEMLNDKFECVFIIREPFAKLKEEILQSCNGLIEIQSSKDLISEAEEVKNLISNACIIVLDGYGFDTTYQQILRETGCLLVCIDDIHAYHFLADIVINHAGGVAPEKYSKEFYTQLYLGPSYALLRKPFYPQPLSKQSEGRDGNVMILLGGADPGNATKNILAQCIQVKPAYHYHVVIGAGNIHLQDLRTFLQAQSDFSVTIYQSITAEEVANLMRKCGIAITAPSTVAFEYLYIGGVLYLCPIADNQRSVYKYFIENKLAGELDNYFTFKEGSGSTPEVKLSYDFVSNLRNIFDNLLLESEITVRPAILADGEQVFKWINDPDVRKQSYRTDTISRETHLEWYDRKINDANCRMYLFSLANKIIGQIRFDMHGENATLSYLLDKECRGKGLGSIILKRGILLLQKDSPCILKVIGFVKNNNVPSVKSFRKLGFREEIAEEFHESFKYTLSL